jgi:hypothetical protein
MSMFKIPIQVLAKTYTLAKAVLTGKDVTPEVLRKRLEICAQCDNSQPNGAVMKCGVCGCLLKDSGLINLARYQETGDYGCKHADGSKWKAAGL